MAFSHVEFVNLDLGANGTQDVEDSRSSNASGGVLVGEMMVDNFHKIVKTELQDLKDWIARELQQQRLEYATTSQGSIVRSDIQDLRRDSQKRKQILLSAVPTTVTVEKSGTQPNPATASASSFPPKRTGAAAWYEADAGDLLKPVMTRPRRPSFMKQAESVEGIPAPLSHRQSSMRRMDWEERMTNELGKIVHAYNSRREAEPSGTLADFVHTKHFTLTIALAIMANSVVIGLDVQNSMTRALAADNEPRPEVFIVANYIFACLFAVELLLNVAALRWNFLIGPGWQWNLFDAMLVLVSVSDVARADGDGHSTGYVRLLRIVRMARVLRIIRIFRFFRELRCMCMSILSCFVSLLWALLLLTLVVYIFAVIFMQAGALDLEDSRDNEFLWRLWYGTLGETMYTLTKAISGGENWAPMVLPLQDVSPIYVFLFQAYILFIIFGALNVLTGVFLQRAVETMNHDRDWLTQEERIKMEHFVINLTALFDELDFKQKGKLTWEDFLQAMENPSTQAFFTSHDLDIFDAHLVYSTVADGEGCVSVIDFVHGCSRASGCAKGAHLMALMKKVEEVHSDLKKGILFIDSEIQDVSPGVIRAAEADGKTVKKAEDPPPSQDAGWTLMT